MMYELLNTLLLCNLYLKKEKGFTENTYFQIYQHYCGLGLSITKLQYWEAVCCLARTQVEKNSQMELISSRLENVTPLHFVSSLSPSC